MRAKLIVNDLDLSSVIREGGLQQSEEVRLSRSVTTLDGTLHQVETVKRNISVSLVGLRDDGYRKVMNALKTRPATVTYVDDSLGERTALFYVESPGATAKTVWGGHTWYSDISFSLKER